MLAGPLITAGIFLFLELMRQFVIRIPNPVGLYVLGVLLCALFGGIRIGLVGAAMTLLYGSFIDLDPTQWFANGTNITWISVMVVLLPSVAVMVGYMKLQLERQHRSLLTKTREQESLTRELAIIHGQLTDAVESLHDGFALFDASNRLVACNERYRALTPRVPDTVFLRGTLRSDIIRATALSGQIDGIAGREEEWIHERIGMHGNPHRREERRLSDGRWIEYTEHPTRNGSVVALRRDITSQRSREQELVDREAHSRAILDNVINGVITITETGIIELFNPSAEHIFGYSAAEAIGRNVNLLMPEPYCSEHNGYLARYCRTGTGKVMGRRTRVTGMRKDGSQFPMQLGLGEYRLAGRRIFIASVQDLGEAEALEAQLRQAQKMEALGQLTGGIAHDFNNLLSIIVGNLELLGSKARSDEERESLTDSATKAAMRGAELTLRLLAFSRRQALLPRVVAINDLVESVAKLLRRTLGQKIVIQTRLAENLWNAFVDPGQLENALVNLAVNSRDAMPQGGTLLIETANTSLDENYVKLEPDATAGEYVAVIVSDSGSGMVPDVLRRAFDPFFTTKELGRGTGLGLSMVYGFAKQSGGHVKIYSEPGHGTVVRLYLPRRAEDAIVPQLELPRPSAPEGLGRSILLVEDDPEVQRVAVTMLKELHYQVYSASTADTALELLQQHPDIQLLFSDIMLHGQTDGVELARRAKERDRNLRVLLTSGFSEHAIGNQVGTTSDYLFISKPYMRDQLARTLSAAWNSGLQGQRPPH